MALFWGDGWGEGNVPIDRSSREDNIQNPSIDKIMIAMSLIDPPPDLICWSPKEGFDFTIRGWVAGFRG